MDEVLGRVVEHKDDIEGHLGRVQRAHAERELDLVVVVQRALLLGGDLLAVDKGPVRAMCPTAVGNQRASKTSIPQVFQQDAANEILRFLREIVAQLFAESWK